MARIARSSMAAFLVVGMLEPLACIAHKSLEICERCRLWQQNSPATPGKIRCFWRGEFKNSLFRYIYLNQSLRQRAQPLSKSFLARNELVASAFA